MAKRPTLYLPLLKILNNSTLKTIKKPVYDKNTAQSCNKYIMQPIVFILLQFICKLLIQTHQNEIQ